MKTSGKHGRSTRSSGSPAHRNETVGPGPLPGAGEQEARGPGKSAETRARLSPDMYPSDKTPSAKEKVSDRTRGDEEDGE